MQTALPSNIISGFFCFGGFFVCFAKGHTWQRSGLTPDFTQEGESRETIHGAGEPTRVDHLPGKHPTDWIPLWPKQ